MQLPLILGHRGASAHHTENTLEAFLAARDAGADGIELDVQLCATGEPVVFHDADLGRLAGRDDRVTALPLAALRQVRLARGCVIPTLDEVLGELAHNGFVINVEIKSESGQRPLAAVRAALECMGRHEAGARMIISSFDPRVLFHVRRLSRDTATGLLFHRGQSLPLRRAWPALALRPRALHPEHTLVTRERMARWHRRGYAVNVWTVDEPVELRRLASLGVDSIITNDPLAARRALDPGC